MCAPASSTLPAGMRPSESSPLTMVLRRSSELGNGHSEDGIAAHKLPRLSLDSAIATRAASPKGEEERTQDAAAGVRSMATCAQRAKHSERH